MQQRIHQAQLKRNAEKIKREWHEKASRLRAQHPGRAIDGTLADCGSGLRKFTADPASCRVLQGYERRYLVDRKRPAPFSVPEGVPNKRSCILDKRTNTTAFDLELGPTVASHPVAPLTAHEGPNDLPQYYYSPQANFSGKR